MSEPLCLVPDPTPWEAALSLTSAERRPIDADLVRRVFDEDDCPFELLPYLAAHSGVRLWYEDWSEFRKRSMIAETIRLRRQEGTLSGIKGYLGYVDATVRRVVKPPAKIFLVGGVTEEQREAYVAGLPQIRIYPFDTRSIARTSATFIVPGQAGLGRRFVRASRGSVLYGRRATLQLPGESERTASVTIVDGLDGVAAERVGLPMTVGRERIYLGRGFIGVGHLRASRAAANLVTIRLADGAASSFSAVSGLAVQDVRPVRIFAGRSLPRARAFLARGHAPLGHRFLRESDGPRLIYDRVSLLPPRAAAPILGRGGRSYLGRSRFGIRPWTAELLVEVAMSRPRWRMGVGRTSHVGRAFLRPSDLEPVRRLGIAIATAKSADDTILTSTEVYRTVRLGDARRLGTFRLGQVMRRT